MPEGAYSNPVFYGKHFIKTYGWGFVSCACGFTKPTAIEIVKHIHEEKAKAVKA